MRASSGITVNAERGEVTGVANTDFGKEPGQNGNLFSLKNGQDLL